MNTKDDVSRNALKIAVFIAAAWASYKIINGISRNKPAEQIVKETVTEPVKAVESVIKKTKTGLKHFVKGSNEAKEYMAKLREKAKSTPRKPRTKKSKNKIKAEAGRIGGEVTASLGEHKGHSSEKGLVQDQNKESVEVHEEHYQKTRKKKVSKKE